MTEKRVKEKHEYFRGQLEYWEKRLTHLDSLCSNIVLEECYKKIEKYKDAKESLELNYSMELI